MINIEDAIIKAIKEEIAKATEEQLEIAKKNIAAQLSRIVADVSIRTLRYVSFERLATTLVIKVEKGVD